MTSDASHAGTSFTFTGFATVRGSGTRAAGPRGIRPSSTASVNAARSTLRQIYTLRRDSFAAVGEHVDPPRDVVAVEPRQRDRTELALDVRDRPGVLLTRFRRDVGLAVGVAADEPTHRAALGASFVRPELARGGQPGALRCVRTDLPGPTVAGLRIDPLDANGPLLTVLADCRLTRRFPTHGSPLGVFVLGNEYFVDTWPERSTLLIAPHQVSESE